jgi:MFS superfamily sulfate permease-like transporter
MQMPVQCSAQALTKLRLWRALDFCTGDWSALLVQFRDFYAAIHDPLSFGRGDAIVRVHAQKIIRLSLVHFQSAQLDRRPGNLERMCLRIEDPLIFAVIIDLKRRILASRQQSERIEIVALRERILTGACIKYEYFMTSANKKLSWTLSNEPPLAALTSEIAEKPLLTLVVALMATKASHAQSWYIVLPVVFD